MFKFLREIKSPHDRFYLALMVFAICEQTIFIFPLTFVSRIMGLESIYSIMITIIYILLALGSISSKRLNCISAFTLFIVLFFYLSILLSYLFFPENSNYIDYGWQQELKPVIPWFLLGTCFYADKISMDTIGKWCSFGVIFLSWYLLINNNQIQESDGEYNMQASYRLLLSVLITLNYAFSSKNKWAIGASIIGIIYSIAMGTRGPVLIITAFLLILISQKIFETGTKKIWLVFFVAIGGLAFYAFGKLSLLLYIQSLLADAGFSTRLLDLAISNEMLESDSRQMIYETLVSEMQNNPSPHGLYSEKSFGFFSAHNMYLEVLYYYGLVLGALILLLLVLLPIISYRKSQNPMAKQWIRMFACLVFIHGIWGGKFLSPDVFFMIGLCAKEIHNYNTTKFYLIRK